MGKKRGRNGQALEGTSPADDWLGQLVKQSAAESVMPSKSDRVEKKAAKKKRRQERNLNFRKKAAIKADESLDENPSKRRVHESISLKRLKHLADAVQRMIEEKRNVEGRTTLAARGTGSRPYKKIKWNESDLQPQNRDYGGIGLARPSMFLSFDDPSMLAKLEEEFNAHIPGFFGKQRTKAMKKQLGSKMLWRQLSDKSKTANVKVNGRKLSEMTADERVEAMLRAGMI